jgi:RNA recognition motif-containing protein
MTNKLYVGNLTEDIFEEDLLDNFGDLGTCLSARIIKDKKSSRSKCFAFVEMATEAEALEVLNKCKGVELDGQKLVVRLARPYKGEKKGEPSGGSV